MRISKVDAGQIMRALPLALTFVVVCIMLFSPASESSVAIPHIDKVVHAVMFAALGFTSRLARIGIVASTVWLGVFAVISEIAQGLMPFGRTADPWDVVADVVGALAGILLHHFAFRPKRAPTLGDADNHSARTTSHCNPRLRP
ncbi:VanZ family protein [Hoyosella rhizosphaerae]|uniref:VanZ-like domain-containing protein n=1 Tax=Hoyosella rhizosphaerae TaxID=1755582 RepID=A0A916XEJ1_9ACTN|nr:VanZ family protein [Hoyosella rhizosphaerae]MBN4926040.1 VanZ family protein [Hoyosella rhizosphaerae]GGC66009.1 hypothetical protein GCM10011410_18220 [Hoyosella rhizosphaerae]